MSKLSDLHSVLMTDGLTLDSIARLVTLSHELYFETPTLAAFTAYSLCRGLLDDFDDNQAVNRSRIAPFVENLLPELKEWTASDDTFGDLDRMNRIAVVYRNCHTTSS